MGDPEDKLRLSLQADSAGKPSGISLASALISPEQLQSDNYSWQNINLPLAPELIAGRRYWLVLERSAALNAAHFYQIAVDENLNFAEGSLRLFDQSSASWKSRAPDADLLFKLSGVRNQLEQMRDVLATGGQFLHGLEAQLSNLPDFSPVSEDAWDCQKVFRFLMSYGGGNYVALCSGCDPNRKPQVWQQKSAATAVLRINSKAQLINQVGKVHDAPWQAVGEWLAPDAARPLYLRRLSLEPVTGKILLNP